MFQARVRRSSQLLSTSNRPRHSELVMSKLIKSAWIRRKTRQYAMRWKVEAKRLKESGNEELRFSGLAQLTRVVYLTKAMMGRRVPRGKQKLYLRMRLKRMRGKRGPTLLFWSIPDFLPPSLPLSPRLRRSRTLEAHSSVMLMVQLLHHGLRSESRKEHRYYLFL